jgi:hypothetical protein
LSLPEAGFGDLPSAWQRQQSQDVLQYLAFDFETA